MFLFYSLILFSPIDISKKLFSSNFEDSGVSEYDPEMNMTNSGIFLNETCFELTISS